MKKNGNPAVLATLQNNKVHEICYMVLPRHASHWFDSQPIFSFSLGYYHLSIQQTDITDLRMTLPIGSYHRQATIVAHTAGSRHGRENYVSCTRHYYPVLWKALWRPSGNADINLRTIGGIVLLVMSRLSSATANYEQVSDVHDVPSFSL